MKIAIPAAAIRTALVTALVTALATVLTGLLVLDARAAQDSGTPGKSAARNDSKRVEEGAKRVEEGAKRVEEASGHAKKSDSVEQLRRFTKTTQSATGKFRQRTIKSGAARPTEASGDFAFARPGRFRWNITEPFEQLIVTDGRKLYFYDKDLQQVTIRKTGEAIGATPAAVLFGEGELESSFKMKDVGQSDGVAWIEATPKSQDSGFESIRIAMQDGLPVGMIVRDSFGQINEFSFDTIVPNAKPGDDQFHFTPPKGVDVIE